MFKHCAGHGLAKAEDEADDHNDPDRDKHGDYIEQVEDRYIFIIACHRNFPPHFWGAAPTIRAHKAAKGQ